MHLLAATVAATLTLLPIIRAQNSSVNASVISLENNPSNALEATAFSLIVSSPEIRRATQPSAEHAILVRFATYPACQPNIRSLSGGQWLKSNQ